MWKWIAAWLGLNPSLPYTRDVVNPQHGMEAKNSRNQKVIFDENKGWVMPQNFSDKPDVTVSKK